MFSCASIVPGVPDKNGEAKSGPGRVNKVEHFFFQNELNHQGLSDISGSFQGFYFQIDASTRYDWPWLGRPSGSTPRSHQGLPYYAFFLSTNARGFMMHEHSVLLNAQPSLFT